MLIRAWPWGLSGFWAAGIDPVYGRGGPHQLCVFHLRREYWRNLGSTGFAEARRLVRQTAGAAAYWRRKALSL